METEIREPLYIFPRGATVPAQVFVIQGLILHSVSYSGSWGQKLLPLEEFIGKAAALGYDGVMLMAKRPHLSVLDWSSDVKARLRARLEEHGLPMTCVAGYTNFTADLEHGDSMCRNLAEMALQLQLAQ